LDKHEFDSFAAEYQSLHSRNIRITGEAPEFFAEYKIRDVYEATRRLGRQPRKILDFGCGVGNSIRFFKKYFPNSSIVGLDVSEKSLEIARARFSDQAELIAFDGTEIPLCGGPFDIIFSACVFHHIDAAEHVGLLSQLYRLLAPQGIAYIFEHNPLNPLTVRAVNNCEFDANAVLIRAGHFASRFRAAGFSETEIRYRIFFPHALKSLRHLEPYMTSLPFGAQYCIAGR
jgi:SAM-dependent methyltransferase